MRCDILTKDPPEVVEINGIEYPINWDFRIGIKLDELINSDLSENEKFQKMLELYYPIIPADLVSAIEKIIWFYRCGEKIEEEDEKKKRYRSRKDKEPAWIFVQDSPYIYSAFKEQYDMDLTEMDTLHWWKFMALFESLGEGTKIGRIMYYRQVRTTGMSKSQRSFINEMKKLYKIKGNNSSKMTLEQRNRKWLEYIKERQEQG